MSDPRDRNARPSRLFPPIVSGILLAISALTPGAWPLAFVALVPWFAYGSVGRFRDGFAFGVAFCVPMTAWLGQFVSRWTESPALGTIPWLAAGLAMAVYFGLFSVLAGRLPRWQWPFLWTAIEIGRAYVPVLAFPWGLIAHPLASVPQGLGLASLVGEFGVGTSLVALNLGLSVWIVRGLPSRRMIAAWGVPTIALALLGTIGVRATGRATSVVAIQPGTDLAYGNLTPEEVRVTCERLIDEAGMKAGPGSLLVLPEGIGGRLDPSRLDVFVPPPGESLIFGGQRPQSGGGAYQTAVAVSPTGVDAFDKTRLVIFGEFVPGRGIIPYPAGLRLPSGDLAAGELPVRPLKAGTLKVGPVLCFEALFPDISSRLATAGADALAIMSIDDWFAGTSAPRVLAQAAVWRALETGLPVARAASTGETFVANGAGARVAEVEGRGMGAALARVPMTRSLTPWAPMLVPLLVSWGVSAWGLIIHANRHRRR